MPIINDKPFELLVAQLGNEMGNFYLYNQIATHYENMNWKGFAKYFRDAANDELGHYNKIYEYLVKKQYEFTIPLPVKRELPKDMSCESIAMAVLELEENTTAEWYNIYELAKGKYSIVPKNGKQTYSEVEKCEPSIVETIATEFIKIQDDEEEEANDFLAMVQLAVKENNLYNLNKQLEG